MVASAVGYDVGEAIYSGEGILEIKIEPTAYEIEEIVVNPGEDPAVVLFKKILENKPLNDFENQPNFKAESYNKLVLEFTDITEELMDLKLIRPIRFIFDNIDSTTNDEPFLPIFLTETIAENYYSKTPKTNKQVILASKISGLENESLSSLIVKMNQRVNIYDNWLQLMEREYVSPVSDAGLSHYHYQITDTAFIDQDTCFQMRFFPKRKSSKAFNGDLWVADSSYAIKRINMFLDGDVKINFVEHISWIQSFDRIADSLWMPASETFSVKFVNIAKPIGLDLFSKKLSENAPSVRGKTTTTYQNYTFGKEAKPIKQAVDVTVSEEALLQNDSFWNANRHIELSDKEEAIYGLIDTIKTLPVIQLWKRLTFALFTGYAEVGPVEIGNFYRFYARNPVEGSRVSFGVRTGLKTSERFQLSLYGAYGFRDQKYKYGASFIYLLSKSPRQYFKLNYVNDIQASLYTNQINLEEVPNGLSNSDWFRRRVIPFKLLWRESLEAGLFKEWPIGYSAYLGIENQTIKPFFNADFIPSAQDAYTEPVITNFTTTEITFRQRFAFQENFVTGKFHRISLGSAHPIVSLEYRIGLKDIYNSGFEYHKLELGMQYYLKMPPFGASQIDLAVGRIWGRLPYLLLKIPRGNEGLFSVHRGFNLINHYSFAMDRYAMLFVDHHFGGFWLNKIAFTRKLKLRLAASFRAMIGDMNAENRSANANNFLENTTDEDFVRLQVPNQLPYMEVGLGIENILNFFRLDVYRRVNYIREDEPLWGVRGNVSFSF